MQTIFLHKFFPADLAGIFYCQDLVSSLNLPPYAEDFFDMLAFRIGNEVLTYNCSNSLLFYFFCPCGLKCPCKNGFLFPLRKRNANYIALFTYKNCRKI